MSALETRLAKARASLGSDVLILAHHYQRDEIVEHADYIGDSLQLARRAAQSSAQHIVFCGVSFMAETAAVLAGPGQHVYLPREDAGCYLADQAEAADVRRAWQELGKVMDVEREVLPIAYVNTSAEVKEFVGKHEGLCCTSSSAEAVVQAALAQRSRVLFLPDQHLARNTARALKIGDDEIALWDPRQPRTELHAYTQARLIIWRGACNVHVRFLPQDVSRVRLATPDARVIVHPECRPEVATVADEIGSTSLIVRRVREAAAGSTLAIGTEQRLVARLDKQEPDKRVISLGDPPPFCATMSMTRLSDLEQIVSALAQGRPVQPKTVRLKTAGPARRAVQRLLDFTT
ncbi:MAG: quinolinate synthase NadA [Candidatus Bipolaricaulota bacterium]